jgi:hypothetical protein
MSISRRKFIGTGSLVVLAAGLPLRALARNADETSSKSVAGLAGADVETARLNSEAFTRCLNTQFRFHRRGGPSAVLKSFAVNHWEPAASRSRTRAARGECFSVMFLSPDSTRLAQDSYAVEHESLGKFQMLIVPMGESNQGLYYEAVFNRLH